mgnify:CR=1 FL=1
MMHCDLTVSELFQAYYDCRKNKRNTWNALKFEQNLERNLMDLYYELKNKTYEPGQSIMFVVTHPKPREVWAATFRDRIVHHLLYNRFSDHFYRRFIHDSYACIPEKGTLKAAERVSGFVRSCRNEQPTKAWYLKADIANFFVSIDKSILEKLLLKHIRDPWWSWLVTKILHHDPTQNVYIKSSDKLLHLVPPHKSLLNTPKHLGLPIGNLSSQFFANVYLNELDQYVKRVLKVKHYARYVDDLVIISNDKELLKDCYKLMMSFVKTKLKIRFHPNKTIINKAEHGINFVGYIIKPFCKYIRRSTLDNMYKKTKNKKTFEDLMPSVNSYFGMLRHCNGYDERKKAAIYFSQKGAWFDGKLTKIVSVRNQKCISV